MSDVFVSYSRRDQPFVVRIRALLEDAGLDVWVDVEGLYAGEEFWPEVVKAIDSSAAVVFVLSPDSINSKYCRQELDRAVVGQKRIVPLCHREVDVAALHPELAKLQWVFFREGDDPDQATQALLSAIKADWKWLREQARLFTRATEWDRKGRDGSLLLRGGDLRGARRWLTESAGREVGATNVHAAFIQASQRASNYRRVRLTTMLSVAIATIASLTWFGTGMWVSSRNNLSLDDLNKGQVSAAISRLEGTNQVCDRFWSLFRGCRDVRINLGRAYLDAGRYADALPFFSNEVEKARGTKSDDVVAQDFLATAHQNRAFTHIMLAEQQEGDVDRLAQYELAEADLAAAREIYDSMPGGSASRPLAITRARIHLGRGESEQAIVQLEQAGRVSAAPDIDLLLSIAYHCVGDGLKSLEHFRRYMDELPVGTQSPEWEVNKPYYTSIRERCRPPQSH